MNGIDFGQAGEIRVPITVPLDGLQQGLQQARKMSEGTLGQLSKSLDSLGKTFSKFVTVPIVGAVGLSAKAAIDFESAFAGVRKTVAASEKQLAKMRTEFRRLAREIPVSASELAKIGETAGQLGIGTDNIVSFTKTIAQLGTASNLAGEEGATMLARFANITGMDQTKFDNLASAIVALGNDGASSEQEIAAMGLRLAAAGDKAGYTEQQILAVANVLSSLGVEAEAGGSAFSKLIIDISASASLGDKHLAQLAKAAGMPTKAFQELAKTNAPQALMAFVKGLAEAEAAGKSTFLTMKDLGFEETRLRDAIMRTSGASEMLSKQLALGDKAWASADAHTKEAAERYKTTASQLQFLRNDLTEIAITIGERLLPHMRDLVGMARPLADTFNAWAQANPEGLDKMLVAFAALAAIGPSLIALGAVVGSVNTIAQAFIGLGGVVTGIAAAISGASLSTIALWGGLATAVGLGIAAIAGHYDELKATVSTFVRDIMAGNIDWADAMQTARGYAEDSCKAVGDAFEAMRDRAKPAATETAGWFVTQMEKMRTWTDENAGLLADFGHRMAQLYRATVIPALFDLAVTWWEGTWGTVKNIFDFGLREVGIVLSTGLDALLGAMELAMGLITFSWGDAWHGLTEILNATKDAAVQTVELMWEKIVDQFNVAKTAIVNIGQDIKDGVVGAWASVYDILVGHSIVPDLVDKIGYHFDRMTGLITKPTDEAVDALIARFEKMGKSGKRSIEDLRDTMAAMDDLIQVKQQVNPAFGFTADTMAFANMIAKLPDVLSPADVTAKIKQLWDQYGLGGMKAFAALEPKIQGLNQELQDAIKNAALLQDKAGALEQLQRARQPQASNMGADIERQLEQLWDRLDDAPTRALTLSADSVEELKRKIEQTTREAETLTATLAQQQAATPPNVSGEFLARLETLQQQMRAFPDMFNFGEVQVLMEQFFSEFGLTAGATLDTLQEKVGAFDASIVQAFDRMAEIERLKEQKEAFESLMQEWEQTERRAAREKQKRQQAMAEDWEFTLTLLDGMGSLLSGLPGKWKQVAQAAQTASRIIRIAMSVANPAVAALQVAIELASAAFSFLGDEAEKEAKGIDKVFEDLGEALDQWGQQFTDDIVEFIKTGEFALDKFVESVLEDFLRITIQATIVDPAIDFIGGMFAKGAAIEDGAVTPFAKGGVVSGPLAFQMKSGMGLMGEAGPEAIVPLARSTDGSLGIRVVDIADAFAQFANAFNVPEIQIQGNAQDAPGATIFSVLDVLSSIAEIAPQGLGAEALGAGIPNVSQQGHGTQGFHLGTQWGGATVDPVVAQFGRVATIVRDLAGIADVLAQLETAKAAESISDPGFGQTETIREYRDNSTRESVAQQITKEGGTAQVQIIDQRGAGAPPITVERQQTSEGEMLRLLIRAEVGTAIGEGTYNRVLRERFGLRPRGF